MQPGSAPQAAGHQALHELSQIRCSNTPEFQQRLASIVAANAAPDLAAAEQVSAMENLKLALSNQGEIMRLVRSGQSNHQQLLLQVADADEGAACAGGGQLEQQVEKYRADLVRQHNAWRGGAVKQLENLDVELKRALQESRRLLGGAGAGAQVPLRNIQQNIAMVEKETQLVSSSYEQQVMQLKKEICLDDQRSMAEKKSHDDEMNKYRQQCENDSKERKAIKTILEVKITALVDNVRRSLIYL